MRGIFKKNMNSLVPDNSDAEKLLKKIKLHSLVTCEVKKSRNLGFHKKYFSMIKMFIDNIDYRDNKGKKIILTPEYLLDIIKIELKMYKVGYTLKGKEYPIIESVSFAKMDQFEFEEFYSKSLDVLLEILNHNVAKENKLNKREVEENLINYI